MTDNKVHKGKLQVQQSRGNVNYTIRSTSEQIEAIRFNNDKKQKESRMHEEQRRMERYNEIQNEAIQSGKKNAALELKWAESKEIEECEELNSAIETNKDIFKKIIEGKDKLINEFLEELRKKDNDYVKMIKDQSNDIKTMIVSMRS